MSKEARRRNIQRSLEIYHATGGSWEASRDLINVIARGPFDHIIADIKEKARAATRTILNIFKESIT
ncbi:TPA: hypothetical protein ACGO1T_001050 [Streptococcus suis]